MGSATSTAERLERILWHTDADALHPAPRALLFAARTLYCIVGNLLQGSLTLHAMSLVYTTLLSLVPLLAVSFSVLKGFGVHNQLEPMLLQVLAPLGAQAQDVTSNLIHFVDQTEVRVLGSLGLGLLLYSVISLISKIELVFNDTWRVDRQRPLAQRFSQYLSVLLVGPVLFFSAVGAAASLRSSAVVQQMVEIAPLGLLAEAAGRLIPYLLIVAAFTFIYSFVPNTRVRLRSALVGALVAGLLWQIIGYVFATFMAGSTRYAAIYSGLAIPILFMIWIYIAWLIVLIGANIAFYHQYPEYLGRSARDARLSNRLRERLALLLATRIAAAYLDTRGPPTAERLAHALGMPLIDVRRCLAFLEGDGFLIRSAQDPPGYLPARPPGKIPVRELLAAVRRFGEPVGERAVPQSSAPIAALEQQLEETAAAALDQITLAQLAADEQRTDAASPEPTETLSDSDAQTGTAGAR
jgi:membrane protein